MNRLTGKREKYRITDGKDKRAVRRKDILIPPAQFAPYALHLFSGMLQKLEDEQFDIVAFLAETFEGAPIKTMELIGRWTAVSYKIQERSTALGSDIVVLDVEKQVSGVPALKDAPVEENDEPMDLPPVPEVPIEFTHYALGLFLNMYRKMEVDGKDIPAMLVDEFKKNPLKVMRQMVKWVELAFDIERHEMSKDTPLPPDNTPELMMFREQGREHEPKTTRTIEVAN